MGCLIALIVIFFCTSFITFGMGVPAAGSIFLVIAIGLAVTTIIKSQRDAAKNRKAREEQAKAEKRARIQARIQRNKENRQRMIALCKSALSFFSSAPVLLQNAEELLNQAEIDYADNALAPFWDSIENAAKTLGRFNKNIKEIEKTSSSYAKLAAIYKGEPPKFPLSPQSVEKLRVGSETAERMQSIVREAQRNFQFAMIYEQRKTNQILVAGFTTLAQALVEMTRSITFAIDNLTITVEDMSSSLSKSMQGIQSRLDDIAETTSDYLNEQAAREADIVEMLDNIQHGRKPFT